MESTKTNLDENPITEFYNVISRKPIQVDTEVRFLNCLIDIIASFLLAKGVGYFLSYLGIITFETGKVTLYLISFIFYFLYFFLSEWTTGRTLGKFITGTRVMNENGDAPDALTIMGRTLCRFIPFEPISFFINSGGWHDVISGTVVSKIRRSN